MVPRKENGRLAAAESGIKDVRRHLCHRGIQTTSAHHVGKKRRVEVSLSAGAGQLKVVE